MQKSASPGEFLGVDQLSAAVKWVHSEEMSIAAYYQVVWAGSFSFFFNKNKWRRYQLKPQVSFGEVDKFFLDLQKMQEFIRKHHHTKCFEWHIVMQIAQWQIIIMYITYGKMFGGDSEHFYVLVISWKWKHFEAIC